MSEILKRSEIYISPDYIGKYGAVSRITGLNTRTDKNDGKILAWIKNNTMSISGDKNIFLNTTSGGDSIGIIYERMANVINPHGDKGGRDFKYNIEVVIEISPSSSELPLSLSSIFEEEGFKILG